MSRTIIDRINKRLADLGLTARAASLAAGLSADGIRNIERNLERNPDSAPRGATLRKLATALETTEQWLLTGEGEDKSRNIIPVMGYIGAGGEILPDFEQVPPDGLEQIELPFPVPAEMIGLRVRGDSMYPVYSEDDVVIVYREAHKPVREMIGCDAAVRTDEGKRFLKTIQRGTEPGTVNLASWNAKLMEAVRVVWAGEVFATVKSSQWRIAERNQAAARRRRAAKRAKETEGMGELPLDETGT